MKLNLITFSSEEEVKNEWMKNICVLYTLNNLSNTEELKYYNKLYEYKLKLANKDVVIHISDNDLIDLNKNDDIVHLQLVPYLPKLKKAKSMSKSEPSSIRSARRSSRRSKTAEDYDKTKTFNLVINNNKYNLNYKFTKAQFNLFEIDDKFKCYGILDEQAKLGSTAVRYDSITIDNIEMFYSLPLFDLPIYINVDCNITIEQLFTNFPNHITI